MKMMIILLSLFVSSLAWASSLRHTCRNGNLVVTLEITDTQIILDTGAARGPIDFVSDTPFPGLSNYKGILKSIYGEQKFRVNVVLTRSLFSAQPLGHYVGGTIILNDPSGVPQKFVCQ